MGLIAISDDEVCNLVELLRTNATYLSPETVDKNTAKFVAYSAVDKMVVLVGAEHVEGSLHVFNNQLNENAKNFTDYVVIPELNHHYMEGLSFPKLMKGEVIFFVFNSTLYHPRVQLRVPLTIDIIKQQGFVAEMVQAVWKTKMQQVWEVIQLGAYTNFYLAMLNGVDPAPIPWVDAFKEKMGK